MKILAISAELPFPPVGGGRLRIYHWLKALSSRHEVTLVAFTFDHEVDATWPFSLNVICVPWKQPPLYCQMDSDDTLVASRAFEILRDEITEPWYASYFESAAAEQIVRQEVSKGIDLVLFEDSDMARFNSVIPEEIPRVLDFQNVYSLIAQRAAAAKSGEELRVAQGEARRTVAFERGVASKCELCLVCSESEATAVKDLLGVERVAVLPNGVDTTFFSPWSTSSLSGALLFTGSMNYQPNIEAVDYFVAEILPLIHRRRPDVVLHVVGKNPGKELQQLRSETVVIHGDVPDMRPYFAEAEIFVAPILSGGGTRLKILEAAASAKPIITTTLGAEGLDFHPEEDIIIADSPDVFADSVVRLLDDRERQSVLGRNARRASLPYEWRKLESSFCEFIQETAMNTAAL